MREQRPGDGDARDERDNSLAASLPQLVVKTDNSPVDPFRHLVATTRIPPRDNDADPENNNASNNTSSNKQGWQEYRTTSLVPIAPGRQGSAADVEVPYSVDLRQTAKGLGRY